VDLDSLLCTASNGDEMPLSVGTEVGERPNVQSRSHDRLSAARTQHLQGSANTGRVKARSPTT
jgi:hypothetical protein